MFWCRSGRGLEQSALARVPPFNPPPLSSGCQRVGSYVDAHAPPIQSTTEAGHVGWSRRSHVTDRTTRNQERTRINSRGTRAGPGPLPLSDNPSQQSKEVRLDTRTWLEPNRASMTVEPRKQAVEQQSCHCCARYSGNHGRLGIRRADVTSSVATPPSHSWEQARVEPSPAVGRVLCTSPSRASCPVRNESWSRRLVPEGPRH